MLGLPGRRAVAAVPTGPAARAVAVAAVAAVAVAALAVTVAVIAVTGSELIARSPSGDGAERVVAAEPAAAAEVAALERLLSSRAAAVSSADRDAWLVSLPAAGSFRTEQVALFDRLLVVRPARWRYRVLRAQAPPGRLSAEVQLRYALNPTGPEVTRLQSVIAEPGAGGWHLVASTARSVDIWDLGTVERVDGSRCSVLAASSRRSWARRLAAECAPAARAVEAVLPGGEPIRAVLVIPADLEEMARLLDRPSSAGLQRTAAVTVGRFGAPAEAVVINSGAMAQLLPIGRRVVLTHEWVHVVTRADSTTSVPTWLDEGLAEVVAYRGSGLSVDTIAGPVLADVRAARLPDRLPAAADFDATSPDADLAYGHAWSAADTIVSRSGLGALVAVHTRVGRGERLDSALRAEVGVDAAGLIPLWRRHLQELADLDRAGSSP